MYGNLARTAFLTICAVLLLLQHASISAGIVHVAFDAQVTGKAESGSGLGFAVEVGDRFSGSYLYESSLGGTLGSDGRVRFRPASPTQIIAVNLGPGFILPILEIGVRNDAPFFTPDEFELVTPNTTNDPRFRVTESLELFFASSGAELLADSSLPTGPLNLSYLFQQSIATAKGQLQILSSRSGASTLDFEILTMHAVPNPPTVALLLIGIGAAMVMRLSRQFPNDLLERCLVGRHCYDGKDSL